MDYIKIISEQLNIPLPSVKTTQKLLQEENTVPFIARYRKELTGNLDEVQIRDIEKKTKYFTLLEERKNTIIETIEKLGKLTEDLKEQIQSCLVATELEDIYLPYKQKRKTRASVAKEKGLEPLALDIMNTNDPLKNIKTYINQEKGVNTQEEALQGAMDIVAEKVAEDFEIRKFLKLFLQQTATINSKLLKDKNIKDFPEFQLYIDYSEPIQTIKPHRILALNRGEDKNVLQISLEWEHLLAINNMKNYFIVEENPFINKAIEDAYSRLLKPSLVREIRNLLTEKAEEQSIKVFSKNLEQLLLQRPLKGCVILGIDPGIRTGSKYAAISPTGEVLDCGLLQQHQKELGLKILLDIIKKHKVELIAIGDGTGSREVEELISHLLATHQLTSVQYALVPETGASVYSASECAKREFPHLDITLRGAISIARRLQDPISEYVKIDPQSLGVGQYQHDINQKVLTEELSHVVTDSVNKVGVNLNTASVELLQYVSGITSLMAKKIALHRQTDGIFTSRLDLKKIKGLSQKIFEQAAGFLKIPQSHNFLDNTWIHPENYDLAQAIIDLSGGTTKNILLSKQQKEDLIKNYNTTHTQIEQIIKDLNKPNLDPREELSSTLLKNKIVSFNELKVGTICQGKVKNIVDFGAFIDIGLKNDGLVHISEIAEEYIKHPLEKLNLGDILQVMITDIDTANQKVKLSIKQAYQHKK